MTVSTALKRTFSMLTDAKLRLEFFLPNGLLLPLELDPELTLEEVKRELWLVASREPLFNRLQPVDCYILTGIDRDTGEVEEYYDQSVRIHQLPLLLPFLRLVDAVKDTGLAEANARNAVISSCVGVTHADIVRAARENPEVRWARLRMLGLASLHARALQAEGPLGQALYLTASPQRQQLTKSFVKLIERRFLSPTTAGPLTITAWMLDGTLASARERRVYVNLENPYATVKEAVDALLDAQLKMATQQSEVKPGYPAEAYALKVCCTQAYLFDPSQPLVSYEYVQNCLEQGQLPCLSPMLREDIGNFISANFSDQHWKFCFGDLKPTEGASTAEQQPADEYSRRIYQRLDSLVLGEDASGEDASGEDEVAATLKSCQEEVDQDVDRYLSTIVPQAGDSRQKEQTPRVNESSAVSIWELPAYLSIQVCGGQFLPFETVGGTPPFSTAPQGSGLAGQQTVGFGAPANNGSGMATQLYQGIYVVRVGLFHGSQSLIEYQTTSGVPGHQLEWNRWLGFHVYLADIPLAARLSVALIRLARTGERRSSKVYEYPVAWANLNFFDHCGFMISGELELRLWPASLLLSTDDRFQGLYPAGTVLANPNPEVVLRICVFNPISMPIRRPCLRSPFTSPSPAHSLTRTSLVTAAGDGDAKRRLPITGQLFAEDDEERHELSEETAEEEESGIVSQPCRSHHRRHSVVVGLSTLAGSCRTDDQEPPSPSLLQGIVSRDPLFELSEQDKDTLWCGRRLCQAMLPTVSLPWVAQSVCWYRRESVTEFYDLLLGWPRPLTTQVALQLLGAIGLSVIGLGGSSSTGGGQCQATVGVGALAAASGQQRGCANGAADALLRQLAVHSLQTLSDAELSDYLLQLVQSLKAEAYLDNPLSRFLLVRALRNPGVIGLRFFWHLRSELHVPDLRIRFGLLLEAFCHGCGPLLPYLARQVTALNRLETISARVKQAAPNSEEEQRVRFREEVSRVEAKRDLQWLPSPLGLSDRLGELVVQKCDVKRSKKKPLWLVWTNPDLLACHHNEHYQIIFKHGDDLRQDMLTLYLLRIMDRIWKEEGLDMCMMPYGCLATGLDMGLIEAVRNARTVMSIQGERLRSALQIDSTQLYRWLMQCLKEAQSRQSTAEAASEHRRPPVSDYEQVICNFTHSCAGYCVATFVLGIRDRHPDNIMVDTTGHLFHIDFGHILDNRKKKFGITRERVPFVLTKDFVTVIARGHPDATSAPPQPGASNTGGSPRPTDFQAFIQLCVRAYLMLRRHANLLLTLLAMMLPSGLPELTSAYDLEYVRETLAVDMPDESSASAYFLKKFNNAYSGAWTTKIDWFSHWMNT